jgi:hypothetical protein
MITTHEQVIDELAGALEDLIMVLGHLGFKGHGASPTEYDSGVVRAQNALARYRGQKALAYGSLVKSTAGD